MTPQEQQMIQGLIDRVNQTQLPEKDRDAEQLIQQSLGRNPDALYILAQTVLVQGYALQQAQHQLADARNQLDQARQQPPQQQHTSFLGSLFGHNDPPAPPPPPSQPQSYAAGNASYGQPQTSGYAPVPNYTPGPGSGNFGASPSSFGAPAGGGFLRGAMQTAAGVAAGALAFQGIESLMHGFGGSGGYGVGGFGGGAPREEVINNYYGDSGDRGSDLRDGGDRSDFDTAADNNGSLSPDLEDRRFDNTGDGQTGDDTTGFNDDTSASDSFGSDDISSNDDASFDDGGGFDSGGDDNSSFS